MALEELYLEPVDSGVGYPMMFPASVPDEWRGSNEYVVASADPGGTTGWNLTSIDKTALLKGDVKLLESVEFWSGGELTGSETRQASAFAALCLNWRVNAVVLEDFILRTAKGGRDLLAPVRVTAGIEQELSGTGLIIIKQQPSLAMSTMTDGRLKASGLYVPGMPHANDSTRHSWTWLRRKKALLANGKTN